MRSPIKSHIHSFVQPFNSQRLLSSSESKALDEVGALGSAEMDGTVPALGELKNQSGNYNAHFTDEYTVAWTVKGFILNASSYK